MSMNDITEFKVAFAKSAILDRPLEKGSHSDPKAGACVQEWLRLHEGQEFNDKRLPCQSPVLHRALMGFNDRMPEESRQRLKDIALMSLGTVDDGKDQERLYRLADVACREWAPTALEARGHKDRATKLRALPPVRTKETAARAYAVAYADAAAAAAYAAAYDADAYAADAAAAAYAAADAAADAAAAHAAAPLSVSVVWARAIEVLEELIR